RGGRQTAGWEKEGPPPRHKGPPFPSWYDAPLLARPPPQQQHLRRHRASPFAHSMQGYEHRSMDWMKATSPKATSLIASGDTEAACSAVSRDYVFDSPEL